MKMKTGLNSAPFTDNPFLTWWLPILLGMLTTGTAFAADANPPEKMAYQGYMTDSNGDPLGATAPANYDAVFRIWTVKEGGTDDDLLWAEQQTVTFDKGYFSVLLGEGSNYGSQPRGSLAAVFRSSTASDRYIDITVELSNDGVVTLIPRLKLVSSPYSFLAEHARSANRILGVNSSDETVDVLKVSGENVGIGLDPNASPDKQLDVKGATQLRSSLEVKGQTNLEGPVAIGTSAAPTAQLDVQGDIKVSGAFSLANNLTITGGNINVTPPFNTTPPLIADNVTAYPLIATYPGSPSYKLNLEMRPERWAIGSTGSSQIMYLNNGGHYSFWIWQNGKVGVGGDLEVRGNYTHTKYLVADGYIFASSGYILNGPGKVRSEISHNTAGLYIKLTSPKYAPGAVWNAYLYGNGWGYDSDRRLKTDIHDAESMMDRLMQVPVRRFKWKNSSEEAPHHLGVIAQEVEPLFPELVHEGMTQATIPFAPGEQDVTTKAVTYATFGLLAVKGLQELKAEKDDEIQQLREALAERDARIAELDARVAELDAGQSKILELEERLNALTGSNTR